MAIFVNQSGYPANGTKHATITESEKYFLYDYEGNLVLEGETELKYDDTSFEKAGVIDFSSVTGKGSYLFMDENGNCSVCFDIKDDFCRDTMIPVLKMFYYQRCGCALEEKYAGIYRHKACHTGLVDELRGDRKNFECLGGWHDAGDYGRYSTAGAVAVQHLLMAYRLFPEAFRDETNIPESGNGVPDVLNEARYELEWLLKMVREDGAVYHKCTALHHADMVMPEEDLDKFYVTPVSSVATGDIAGLFAMAAKIYRGFDGEFADRLAEKAKAAGEWLIGNPEFLFENPEECTTGGYGDWSDMDERFFAYAELYGLTADVRYLELTKKMYSQLSNVTALGWGFVPGFGSLCIIFDEKNLFPEELRKEIADRWIAEADRLMNCSNNSPYDITLKPEHFGWGSNMKVGTDGMILSVAYVITKDKKYLDCAAFNMDYLFGRNALGISYVTGIGERSVNNIHNRPTVADGIEECIPGFVSGGPNAHPNDAVAKKMIPRGCAPQKSFVDHIWGYSVNEITIYWNSPVVFVLAALRIFA